ncbi:hypothetical protein Tco_0934462, partial [Tanacetum coccineum]
SSGGNHGGQSSSDKSLSWNEVDMTLQSVYDLYISLCTQVTDQAKKVKHLKAQIKKLKKKAKPVITHHRSWKKSVSLKQRLAGKKSLKKQWMQKEFVSKQGRKPAKAEPSVHKDPLFDELADDTLDYIDTENAQDVGRTRNVVYEEEESVEDVVSTKDVVSTDKEKVSTDRSKVSTDRSRVSTDKEEVSTDRPDEDIDDQTKGRYDPQTPPTTTTLSIFGDDETIAQVLIIMSQNKEKLKEKEKGVELKDVEETERPRPTSTRSLLTLKPLPKIDPKDKGKKKIEEEDESDTESECIPEAEKKFKQLARDEEMARKVQEDWEAEEEVKNLAEEEAIKAALSNEYDFFQARIEADRLLALRLQDEERERESSSLWKREQNSFMIQLQLNEGLMEVSLLLVPLRKKEKISYKIEDMAVKDGFIVRLNKISSLDGDYLVIYRANGKIGTSFNYLMEGDLKIMMESSTEENDQSDFWSNQHDWKIITWRLYEACGVCILEFEDGTVIHMHKNWLALSKGLVLASQDKTVLLTIPEQMATGKGTSNPFMAGSLPKTTKPT